MSGEKPFKPTNQRLKKALREGHVIKCPYLSQTCVLTIGFLSAICYLRFCWLDFKLLVEFLVIRGWSDIDEVLNKVSIFIIKALLICLVPAALTGCLIEYFQRGFSVPLGAGFFGQGRVTLSSGIKKIVQGLKNLWIHLIKIFLLAGILFWVLFGSIQDMLATIYSSESGRIYPLIWCLNEIIGYGIGYSLIISTADYWVQRRRYMKSLMMSHDEVKRENRETEGDPSIRGQRKALHQALVMQDLVSRVRKAKVVIVERNNRSL